MVTAASPSITFEWDVVDMPSVTRRVNGRRLSITPRRVRVHTRRRPGDLSLYIDGNTIKANGFPGQHRRTISWGEDPAQSWAHADFSDLPPWAIPFLEEARSLLAGGQHRHGSDSQEL